MWAWAVCMNTTNIILIVTTTAVHFQWLLWGTLHNQKCYPVSRRFSRGWHLHSGGTTASSSPPGFWEITTLLSQSETHTNLDIHSYPLHTFTYPEIPNAVRLQIHHLRISLRTWWCGNYNDFGLAKYVCPWSEKPRSFSNSWLPRQYLWPLLRGLLCSVFLLPVMF